MGDGWRARAALEEMRRAWPDLTVDQGLALLALVDLPEGERLTMREIQGALGGSPSAAMRAAARLGSAQYGFFGGKGPGLVEQWFDPERNERSVALTPKGAELARRVRWKLGGAGA
ncbi:MAG: hypothetical protein AAFR16_00245 [Pseudomonadota bacterium]